MEGKEVDGDHRGMAYCRGVSSHNFYSTYVHKRPAYPPGQAQFCVRKRQQKPINIKAQGSDKVLTEPHEVKECWTNYFSSLLNVQQHQELMTMSEPTAVVEHQHITEHAVESAVKRSNSGKAPMCDIIPNEVYKAG